jgi:hypothetical protein
MKLYESQVKMGQPTSAKRRAKLSRPGYVYDGGLTFLPPVSAKRKDSWIKSMKENGYKFA